MGTRVRQPDLHELVEAYVVRNDLEVLGARLGVSRITGPDRTISAISQETREAAAGDRHAVATADAGFHSRLIRAGRQRHPPAAMGLARTVFSRTYITLIVPGSDLVWSAHLHDPILEALQNRDQQLGCLPFVITSRDARGMLARVWAEQQSRVTANGPEGRDGGLAAAPAGKRPQSPRRVPSLSAHTGAPARQRTGATGAGLAGS